MSSDPLVRESPWVEIETSCLFVRSGSQPRSLNEFQFIVPTGPPEGIVDETGRCRGTTG